MQRWELISGITWFFGALCAVLIPAVFPQSPVASVLGIVLVSYVLIRKLR